MKTSVYFNEFNFLSKRLVACYHEKLNKKNNKSGKF